MGFFTRVADMLRVKPKATQRQGVGGTNAVGGFLVSAERSSDLTFSPTRFKTLNEMLLNTAIVGAGVRYYQSIIAGISWTVDPPDDADDDAKEYAELIDDMIHDMRIPWYRVVRGAALFKMMGFSLQEWVAKRRDDGLIGFDNIERRPQFTIEQWDLDEDGLVAGFVQRVPYSGQLLYLPREKMVYLVDDSITDMPDGIGLLRHVVEPNRQLRRFEQLEGWVYETDLRGIPVGKAPLGTLQQLVNNGVMSPADRDLRVKGITDIVKNHIKNPGLGLVRDSAPYTDQGPNLTPSSVDMYGLELLRGDGAGLREIDEVIKRKNLEIARVLGVEHLLLGGDSRGSHALAHDKTDAFFGLVASVTQELAESFRQDVVGVLFDLNGWDRKKMPSLLPDKVSLSSVTEMMMAILQMSQAGAYMPPDDPIWDQLRDMLGVVSAPKLAPEVAGLIARGGQPGSPENPFPAGSAPNPTPMVPPGTPGANDARGAVQFNTPSATAQGTEQSPGGPERQSAASQGLTDNERSADSGKPSRQMVQDPATTGPKPRSQGGPSANPKTPPQQGRDRQKPGAKPRTTASVTDQANMRPTVRR